MCLLSFYPPDALPNTDALTNGACINSDGHGFAIVAGSRLLVRRGMDSTDVVADFARLRHKHRGGPALFHSRMGTHGSVGKTNCHPFRLGRDSRTVLAHNGILPTVVQPGKGDRRSDTRIAAEDFLPSQPFGSFDSRRGRDRLAKWLTPHNKIVILTVNPRYGRNAYLLNEDSGIWDDGVWYSNTDYLPDDSREYWRWWMAEQNDVCRLCGGMGGIDPVSRYCLVCGACDDCGELAGYCACYVPGKWDDESDVDECRMIVPGQRHREMSANLIEFGS